MNHLLGFITFSFLPIFFSLLNPAENSTNVSTVYVPYFSANI